MEKQQFIRYRDWAQFCAWALLFFIMLVEEAPYMGAFWSAYYALLFVITQAAAVYVHYLWLFPLFIRGQRLLYVFLTLLSTSAIIFVIYYLDTHVLIFGEFVEGEYETFIENFAYTFPIALLLMAGSTVFYFAEQWFKNLQKESMLKSEKLEAELNFLKSQINPHFLFNTLNNVYSYVQTGNEKSAPMLERLSSVLRFMVYECSEEKVELSKELEAIEDLLEIYKMKNSGQKNISFTASGVKGYHLIAPLILVNLVENACKHSDAVSNPDGFIKVVLAVNANDHCTFEVVNTVKASSGMEKKFGGVGQENVMKRLSLQYGADYKMHKEEQNGVYSLKLALPLERKS